MRKVKEVKQRKRVLAEGSQQLGALKMKSGNESDFDGIVVEELKYCSDNIKDSCSGYLFIAVCR